MIFFDANWQDLRHFSLIMTQSALLPFKNWPGVDDARSWGQPHLGRATACGYFGAGLLGMFGTMIAAVTFGGEDNPRLPLVAACAGMLGLTCVFLWYFQREVGRRKLANAPYFALGLTAEDIRAGGIDLNEHARRYHEKNKTEIDILAHDFYRISTEELGLHPDYVLAQLAASGENIGYPRAMEWHMHGHTAAEAARSLYLWSAMHAKRNPKVFVRDIETGKEPDKSSRVALVVLTSVVLILAHWGIKQHNFSMSPEWTIAAPLLSIAIGLTGGIIAYGSARRLHAIAVLRAMSPAAKCVWISLTVMFSAWILLRGAGGLATLFLGESYRVTVPFAHNERTDYVWFEGAAMRMKEKHAAAAREVGSVEVGYRKTWFGIALTGYTTPQEKPSP